MAANGLWLLAMMGVLLRNRAHCVAGYSEDVAVGPDGTVFLASRSGGLRAFSFDALLLQYRENQ